MMPQQPDTEQTTVARQVVELVNQTGRNIFLTGKAGTGKTTLLRRIMAETYKNTVVVAPTGIAALNAGGVTIHSLFQLPFASFLPTLDAPPAIAGNVRFENRHTLRKHFRMHRNKREIIQNLELLIVDEASMLRADVLDAMDFMLRTVRRIDRPFGGVQVLFIGDLMQLPPVVKNDEREALRAFYPGMFFFHAHVIVNNPLLYIELDKIYRQSDPRFIALLNNLRNNSLTNDDRALLDCYVRPDFRPGPDSGYITLTTRNADADEINARELDKLETPVYEYHAHIAGEFPETMYPIEPCIRLKEGARVMFVKNDLSPEKRFYNGKMGTVVKLDTDDIAVALDDGDTIQVDPYEWENIRYRVDDDTKEIEEERLGTYTQYPLRPAWAITVHKSQGLTFDRAILDLDRIFAAGQAYVAFSRLRSLDGLILHTPFDTGGIETDRDVADYGRHRASAEQIADACRNERTAFLHERLTACFNWKRYEWLWRQHADSYVTETGPKSMYKTWAATQAAEIAELTELAARFTRQLQQLFLADSTLDYIAERFGKALDYFTPRLEHRWFDLMRTRAEAASMKQAKQFRDELTELEDELHKITARLFKADQILRAVVAEQPLSNKTVNATAIRTLHEQLRHRLAEHIKASRLITTETDEPQKHRKKETAGRPPTHLVTLDCWNELHSIEAVAERRTLTTATVYRHLARLIADGLLSVDEFLEPDALAELRATSERLGPDARLSELHAAFDGKYTWNDLQLFHAGRQGITRKEE